MEFNILPIILKEETDVDYIYYDDVNVMLLE